MSQNHDFKSNFIATPNIDDTNYDYASNVRNVCFVLPNGNRMFFNYAYLVSGALDVQKKENSVAVCFTSHTVVLNGYNLATLFELFITHTPKLIAVTHIRYIATNSTEPIITNIDVK